MRVVDLPRKAPVPRELEESTMNDTTNTGGPAFPHYGIALDAYKMADAMLKARSAQ